MPLTLREALTMAEPLQNAHVRAGQAGLDNIVTSVNVMEVPDILNWVRPGQLLVTTLYPLRNDSEAINDLVPSLASKGLAGLAITPSGFIPELPQSMLDAADERGFPLIELPPEVSFIDIIQPLTSRILNLQAEELKQSERILHQFLDIVLSGGSYSDIANVIAQFVGCAVSVVDQFRCVLGMSSGPEQSESYAEFIRHDGQDSYLTDTYRPEFVENIAKSEDRYVRVPGPNPPLTCVVCPVKVSSMVLGEIILWGPRSYPLPFTHLMAIGHGSTVVALRMMVTRSIHDTEQRFRNEILDALLSDQPHVRDRMMYLSNELSTRLIPPFVVILVKPDMEWGTLVAKSAPAEQSAIEASLQLAKRYIRQLAPSASFWQQGPRLVVFVPADSSGLITNRETMSKELRAVCDRIALQNEPYTVSMGISPQMSDLDGFRQAYELAEKSLGMGRTLRNQAQSVVTNYEELGLFRIVSASDTPTQLQSFCDDTIGPLISYDIEHDTNLVHTLRVLLEQNRNLAKAARILNVHYNTLRYRVERIEDVLGDALENPQLRLAIEVALQLHLLSEAE